MSEREQWWKEVTIHNYDEVVDGGRCIASEDERILLKPAQPAAGSWRTDVENAPVNEWVLTLNDDGSCGLWRIYYSGILSKDAHIVRWAPIYPEAH